MTFSLLSPAGVLASKPLLIILVLLTPTARTIQSTCVVDIKNFPGMEFVSSEHEKTLYFLSEIIDPDRNVNAFENTCKGFSKAFLGEIKTKSQYDFVAKFVENSLKVEGKKPSEIVSWAMLGIRSPTVKNFTGLVYLSTNTPMDSIFSPWDPANQAKYWATTGNNDPPRNPPRYPDWHRNDTCLFMDWSNTTDKGRLADGCCNKRGEPFNCGKTRYICQLDFEECPSSTSGQRSVHGGGGGGGVATSTIVGCLLGLLHYLHYTCSV